MIGKTNQGIYDGLLDVRDFVFKQYELYHSNDYRWLIDKADKAIDLIELLIKDKDRYAREIKSLETNIKTIEKDCKSWKKSYQELYQNAQNLEGQKNALVRENRKIQEYRQQINETETEIVQLNQEISIIKQREAERESKIEEDRQKYLSTIAALNRNRETHYEGTSQRPKHYVLTEEYKTLKEQELDPLAMSIFNLLGDSNPTVKQERKNKLNDLKSLLMNNLLLAGQKIMQERKRENSPVSPKILLDLQKVLVEKLEIENCDSSSPQTIKHLEKAVNAALGEVEYPAPGEWQEDDFKGVSGELCQSLCSALNLEQASLPEELKATMMQTIEKTLEFLELAALAEPPAKLSADREGAPFRSDYHEAAKGWDEEGVIIKTIYPVYLVSGEAKVKGVVLTEPAKSVQQELPSSNPADRAVVSNPSESDTADSTSSETVETDSTAETTPAMVSEKSESVRENSQLPEEAEHDKISQESVLQTLQNSLIRRVKRRFLDRWSRYRNWDTKMIEDLLKIDTLKNIEKLEEEFDVAYWPDDFQKKIDELLPNNKTHNN